MTRSAHTAFVVQETTANNHTSGSYTFPNGRLVVVAVAAQNNGSSISGTDLGIDDTGADLVWTRRAASGSGAVDYGMAGAIFTAIGNGTPCTLTISNPVSGMHNLRVHPYDYTGFDTGTPIGAILEASGGSTDGAWTPNLSAVPAATSEIFGMIFAPLNSGTPTVDTGGAGYTELWDAGLTDWYWTEGEVRNSSAAQAFGWADVIIGSGGYYHAPAAVAIEIKMAATGQTVVTGLATETDTVPGALVVAKSKAVGLTTESDTVPGALLVIKLALGGLPTETDTVPGALAVVKAKAVGLTTETDSTLALIAPTKIIVTGLCTETDSALAVAADKAIDITAADEQDDTLGATVVMSHIVAVGLTTETDSSLAVAAKTKSLVVGLTTETSSTFSLAKQKTLVTGLPVESQEALAATVVVDSTIVVTVGQTTETDDALAVAPSKSIVTGLATETGSLLSLSFKKSRLTGLPEETDQSLSLIAPVPPVTATIFQGGGGMVGLAGYRKRRMARDLVKFSGYINDPQFLGSIAQSGQSSVLNLPANGRLAISCSVALTAGQVIVAVGDRSSFSHPALSAGQIYKGSYGERGMPVTVSRGAASAGTFTLYILDLRGSPRPIATVTFS